MCYSINEIIAEKARAIAERNGRARDVYDIVNIRAPVEAERSTKKKCDFPFRNHQMVI